MASNYDKNVSINVEINAEGQQQLSRYTDAFNNLRNSITNLSNPITKLDDNISKLSESVGKLNSESDPVSSVLDKIKKAADNLKPALDGLKSIMQVLKGEIAAFEGVATAGLSVLIAFGPQILEFITSIGKGKEAIDKAKFSLSAMNGALQSSDYTTAIKQINELKINVGLAKKGFIDKKEVLEQYNTTVGKTMGQVSSFNEVENKITKNGPSYIKMTLLKASAQLALQDAAKKAYEAEQIKLKSDEDVLTFWDKTKNMTKNAFRAAVHGPGYVDVDTEVDKINLAKKRREEGIKEAKNQQEALLNIAKKFETDAAVISKKSGYDFFGGKFDTGSHPKIPKPKKRPHKTDLEAV